VHRNGLLVFQSGLANCNTAAGARSVAIGAGSFADTNFSGT
jgi:hypothetical protein